MEILPLVFFFLIIVPSAILHEYAHGWMANQLGDPTAKYAGRLTLNPKVHIDRWGTILMPALLFLLTGGRFMFAYAKPVPYNPYNLRNQRWGPAWVGAAGPLANISLALVFGLALRFLPSTLGIISGSFLLNFMSIASSIVFTNLMLAVFNLVPIPPLDGSKVLFSFLPYHLQNLRKSLERWGFFIVLFFIVFLWQFLTPTIGALFSLLTGISL